MSVRHHDSHYFHLGICRLPSTAVLKLTAVDVLPDSTAIYSCSRDRQGRSLLHNFTRAAHFRREVIQIRQAVFDAPHGRLIVNPHSGLESQGWQNRGINIGKIAQRVIGHHVAAELRAELSLAGIRLLIVGEMFLTFVGLDCIALPQSECELFGE